MFVLERKVTGLYSRGSEMGGELNDGVPDGDLNERMASLEEQMAALRDQLLNTLKEMQDQLNMKLDFNALTDLEKQLMDRLQEMVAGLAKQFADRGDTKKGLKALERQIKNLFDLM